MPTNNQPGSSQQDNDEAVVNDEDKWAVVKRKKSVILPMSLKDFSS